MVYHGNLKNASYTLANSYVFLSGFWPTYLIIQSLLIVIYFYFYFVQSLLVQRRAPSHLLRRTVRLSVWSIRGFSPCVEVPGGPREGRPVCRFTVIALGDPKKKNKPGVRCLWRNS